MPPADRPRDHRRELGRAAEEFAAGWLQRQRYELIERNYRRRWGEADIIARDPNGDVTVIVEVRSRQNPRRGVEALLSIGPRKQRQLLRLAHGLMAESETERDLRVDVIVVGGDPQRGFQILAHVIDAIEDAELEDD